MLEKDYGRSLDSVNFRVLDKLGQWKQSSWQNGHWKDYSSWQTWTLEILEFLTHLDTGNIVLDNLGHWKDWSSLEAWTIEILEYLGSLDYRNT